MEIGSKIKDLRVQKGLTQEELADRTELSKGFISQLERNLTSPSIATLVDILQCLGTDIATYPDNPHEGEEFGYVIEGKITIHLGKKLIPVGTGESFYFVPSKRHSISTDTGAQLIWVSTPPSF